MVFSASLHPCPDCGTDFPDNFHLFGNPNAWTMVARCPGCNRQRQFGFHTYGDPAKGAFKYRELGGPSPSEIIRPAEFLAAFERARASLPDELAVEQLSLKPWRAAGTSKDRAVTCILELLKFLPAGADEIPDAALGPEDRADRASHPERYTRAWLEAQRDWLFALDKRFLADLPRAHALKDS